MSNANANSDIKSTPDLSFEEAFTRLEHILEQMNTGHVGLDESLKLYEEADKLILKCNQRLSIAERTVETLIKNRNGELALGTDQKPLTQEYNAKTPQGG